MTPSVSPPRPSAGPLPRLRPAAVLRVPSRTPVHPGRFLETRYLKPLRINQSTLAEALGISRRRVNELIRGHRGVSPDTAVRLALYFDNDPGFWMQLQSAWDLHMALRRLGARPVRRRER